MAEIAYLVRPTGGTSAFVDQAADHYAARAEVTVEETLTSLEAVLTDLRRRAAEGTVFRVVTLVCEDADPLELPFPVSEARRDVDGGRITTATLQAAVRNAGAPGYPAAPGAPAVTEETVVWVHGPDVGNDVGFVTRLAQLFGPSLTLYAPLVPEVIGGDLTRYRRTVVSAERTPSTHVPDDETEPTPVEEPMAEHFGKYRATVEDANDPEGQGRLKVAVPAIDPAAEMWAAACLPPIPAGLARTPEVGSVVWVEFEAGDVRFPVWSGVTWDASFDPAADLVIESQGNVTIRADNNVVVAAGMAFDVTAGTDVDLRAGTTVTVESGTVLDVRSAGTLTLQSSMLAVSSASARFDGLVEGETLIARSAIVSPAYTPGAGNVW